MRTTILSILLLIVCAVLIHEEHKNKGLKIDLEVLSSELRETKRIKDNYQMFNLKKSSLDQGRIESLKRILKKKDEDLFKAVKESRDYKSIFNQIKTRYPYILVCLKLNQIHQSKQEGATWTAISKMVWGVSPKICASVYHHRKKNLT